MHLGFIGLGHLGRAIAGRLLERGHTLSVWNRTAAKADGLPVQVASSPAALKKEADIIFICLFDSHAVQSVLTAKHGLLSGGASQKIIVDLTTNHFDDVLRFHEFCALAGDIYLESPVLGSVVPAAQGALTVLVSGERLGFEKVKPLLEDIGKHIFYLKDPTLATKMKLINNLALGSFMATIAEALAMGEAVGMDKEEILEILGTGGGQSLVLGAKKGKLLEEDFSPHFTSALIYKDLHCLQDLAFSLKRPLMTGAAVKELYGRTYEEGLENEDFSAIYKLFKKR